MNNVMTVAGREAKAYLLSPLAWLIIALFAFFTGSRFVELILSTRQADLTFLFEWMIVLALILTPALTMRLFSEDYKLGTIELLLTAPAREWQIVLGKFFAAWLSFAVLLIPTFWFVLVLERYSDPDYGALGASYLGMLLVGAAFVGVGMLASALTQNQFVAYIIGMITLLSLWVADGLVNAAGQTSEVADLFRFLSLRSHFGDFFGGVLDSEHMLYFISIAVIAFVLTTLVVASRRWR
jgi:ABC-2 type transport system permease protein